MDNTNRQTEPSGFRERAIARYHQSDLFEPDQRANAHLLRCINHFLKEMDWPKADTNPIVIDGITVTAIRVSRDTIHVSLSRTCEHCKENLSLLITFGINTNDQDPQSEPIISCKCIKLPEEFGRWLEWRHLCAIAPHDSQRKIGLRK